MLRMSIRMLRIFVSIFYCSVYVFYFNNSALVRVVSRGNFTGYISRFFRE